MPHPFHSGISGGTMRTGIENTTAQSSSANKKSASAECSKKAFLFSVEAESFALSQYP